jgi:hypothetical protein
MARKRIPPKPDGEQGVYPRWSPRQWAWVWDATANVDGKQKQTRGHASKHDARIARAELQVSMSRGTQGKAPARLTLGDLVTKHWLPAREDDLTVENSRHQVRWAAARIENAIVDPVNKTTLGSIRLSQLTPDHLERWKRSMSAEGLAQNSRRLLFMRAQGSARLGREARDDLSGTDGSRGAGPRGAALYADGCEPAGRGREGG